MKKALLILMLLAAPVHAGGPVFLPLGGPNWADVAITGGTIDGTTIGGTTPATAEFTALTSATLKAGAAADYLEVEADGTAVFHGEAVVWNDLNFPAFALGTAASAPDLVAFLGAGSLKILGFDGNATAEMLYGSGEILHDWKEGTDLCPHMHWTPTTADAGVVKWQLEYAWVDVGGTTGPAETISFTQTAGGTAWVHRFGDFPGISGTGHHIGSTFMFRVFRNPADSADTYPADAGLFNFGLHYQSDTVGSRTEEAK